MPAPPEHGWWPGRKRSCWEGGEGSYREGEAARNGIETGEERENEMEKMRCTTRRNPLVKSAGVRRGGLEGKKQPCHPNSSVVTSSTSSRARIPAPLLRTRVSSTPLSSSREILSFVLSASYFPSPVPFSSCYLYSTSTHFLLWVTTEAKQQLPNRTGILQTRGAVFI